MVVASAFSCSCASVLQELNLMSVEGKWIKVLVLRAGISVIRVIVDLFAPAYQQLGRLTAS